MAPPPLTPKDEIIKMAAGKARLTQEEMERSYNALRDTYLSVAARNDFQRFNILNLVVAEEGTRKGTTPAELGKGGGQPYNKKVFSFRQSTDLSDFANQQMT